MDNALIHLSAAIAKVGRWETPMRLNPTTRAYFEGLAKISAPERAALYRSLQKKEPLNVAAIIEAARSTLPLSVTRAEDIAAIRELGRRFTPVG